MAGVLRGKRILVVDDEPDICALIVDELPQCQVDTAGTYEDARARLAAGRYDVVVLDVMGVRGYDLLAEFSSKVPCVMLTAHALTPQDLQRSIDGKAALYLPKEEIGRLDEYLARVVSAREPLWSWLFRRLDFSRWFGSDWLQIDYFKELKLDEAEVMEDLEGRR